MHFSIPDTQDFRNENSGTSFTGFNIHINGTFHCCLRYKQLHSLHEQLKRSLPTLVLPSFPPKKFFPLTPSQLEERRASLERYVQLVGQDPVLSKSELLRTFLLNAQQESSYTESKETALDVYLMNGFRIVVNAYTTECSTKVLEKACDNIDLPRDYAYYFALFLMRKENDGSVTLTRKLMDFEAPYITQKILRDCKIVIRKNYWDPCYDLELMRDSIALNLLFIQTLSDVERGWILTTKEARDQLTKLQTHGNKKEFLEVARNLPTYGVIQFQRAIMDYPEEGTQASIAIGNKELTTRTVMGKKVQEAKFKVTRMRCWRVTTIHNDLSGDGVSNRHKWELSFEYLMSKNCLKWITVGSEQAMLMSVCLQSMVDELLNQKSGADMNNMQIHRTNYTPLSYIRRDGSSGRISESSSSDTISSLNDMDMTHTRRVVEPSSMRRKIREKISTTVFFRSGRESVHNEAFEGIGDDDL
ncbi:sorting nexin-17 [Lutzomyia longipalpis]|uniref:Putative sorting nexin n=1 Tax=Lutzomyia longipalpis TaxID=7200 RepID=A0A7G3B1V3_LUTLO|nr:sorting nexin-17 [Lutzomyia longipalpis]XP_055692980.1 sorting nexin-17 [Lutzomyia longipalpis]